MGSISRAASEHFSASISLQAYLPGGFESAKTTHCTHVRAVCPVGMYVQDIRSFFCPATLSDLQSIHHDNQCRIRDRKENHINIEHHKKSLSGQASTP
jgi:hypothetical protein